VQARGGSVQAGRPPAALSPRAVMLLRASPGSAPPGHPPGILVSRLLRLLRSTRRPGPLAAHPPLPSWPPSCRPSGGLPGRGRPLQRLPAPRRAACRR
jgi:hypothetical protein